MTHHAAAESSGFPAITALGVDGFLVSFGATLTEPANRAALAFRAALEAADPKGLAETAPSLTSVYLRFDLAQTDHEALRAALETLLDKRDWYDAPLPDGRRLWHVPAAFGDDHGPQLADAAELAGFDAATAIGSICNSPLRVQTIGFAPGQPYLGALPEQWDIPRQTDLTPRVPEGALVVAIRQVVLFSVTTPTGWRHVGQTALRLFRPDQDTPFLLRPGDEVQFRQVSGAELETIRANDPDGGAKAEALR